MSNGLNCDSRIGLDGSAVPLISVTEKTKDTEKNRIIQHNLFLLADPHKGHRYEIIISLPKLTPEQTTELKSREENGENIRSSSFFVEKLPEEVGIRGVERTYDARLPTDYIIGFIDLDTGIFTPKKTS